MTSKLTRIYDCTINDIVDNESVTNLTIQEAIKNKKTKKIISISIIVSLSALIFSFLGLYLYSKTNNTPEIIPRLYIKDARVSHIDDNNITFKTNSKTISVNKSNFLFIYDTYDNLITFSHLELDDLVELTYENNLTSTSITKVKRLYSYTIDNFLGVIITSNNKKYETLNELHTSYDRGVRYIYSDRSTIYSHNFGRDIKRIINSDSYGYRHLNHVIQMEIDMYVNIFQLTENPVIGLVYDSGIYYEKEIDNYMFGKSLIFEGHYTEEASDTVTYNTYKKVFIINYLPKESFVKLNIYEYDMNNTLVNTTIINNLNELNNFKSHENAIYAYLKEYYNLPHMFPEEFYTYKTYRLNIGESTKFFIPDEYGYIWAHQFNYSPRFIKN